MTHADAAPPTEKKMTEKTIDPLTHPTIAAYFETFNQGDFQATALLFDQEGQLLPPFESAIVGPAAIAVYLDKEAKGMTVHPYQETRQESPDGETDSVVLGQVQTSLFRVNVSWQFLINAQSKILLVRIKLLASLQDLLHLKR